MRSSDRCRAILLLAVTPLLGACSGGDGRDVLVVYSPHGRELLSHYEAEFEALHPEVDVQYLDMGSQEVLDRIRSERANPQADVWWGAPSEMFTAAAAEGLLAPFRPTWAGALDPDERGAEDRWMATYLTPEVIVYNEDAVSREEAPGDWDEVLDPRWTNQVLIRNPVESGTMRAIFAAIIWRESGGTGDPEAGYEWLKRLDAQTKEYTLNPTFLYQKLARQEGLISLWDMPDIETLRATTDYPLNYVIPESGTPVVVDGIAVVANAANPGIAQEFVEWAGAIPQLVTAAERFFRIPARNDLPPDSLPDWLRDALPRITPMEVDREVVGARIQEWMRYWDNNIRGQGASSSGGEEG